MTCCHHHQCRVRELGYRGRESPEQTLRLSVPLQGARVAMRLDLESELKPTLTPAASGLKNVSKQHQKVQSVLERRSEVLDEAIAKEVERNVRRREAAWSAGRRIGSAARVGRRADPT